MTRSKLRAESNQGQLNVAPLILSTAVLLITLWATQKGLLLALRHSATLTATFLTIGVTAFVNVVRYSMWRAFSLQLVHWIFVLTFFFIAPVAQYGSGELPWGLSIDLDHRLLSTNYLVLVWVAIWTLLARPPRETPTEDDADHERPWQVGVDWERFHGMRVFLLLASVAFILEQIATRGVAGLFLRGAASDEATITTSSIDQLVDYGGRTMALSLMVLVVTHQRALGRPLLSRPVLGTMLVVLITNFPFATARFWSALVIIGALATFGALRRRWSLTSTILLGLGIGLPVLGAARHATTSQEFLQTLTSSGNNQAWLTPDFDAFSVLTWTHEYVSQFGDTAGRQLLTCVLFFVPRSVWPTKSVGSGYLIAHQINLPFDNVSNTLPAEGIINFGIPGLIVFAVVSALACSALDRVYWTGKVGLRLRLLYPFLLGAFFFILRGDMLSSMSYTVGLGVPMLLILTLARGRVVRPGATITEASTPSGATPAGPRRTAAQDAVERLQRMSRARRTSSAVEPAHAGATPVSALVRDPATGSSATATPESDTRQVSRGPGEFGWGQTRADHVPVISTPRADARGAAALVSPPPTDHELFLDDATADAIAPVTMPEETAEESAHPAPSGGVLGRARQFLKTSAQPLSYAGFMGIAQILSSIFFILVARRQGLATTAEFMSCYTVAAFASTFIDFGESTNAVRLLAATEGQFSRQYIRYAGARLVLTAALAVVGFMVATVQPFIGCALALGSMMGAQVFFIAAVRIRTGPARLALCFIVEKCVSIALLFSLSGHEIPTYRPIYYLCGGLLANVLVSMIWWPMRSILRHARPSRAAWFGGQHMGVATIINRLQLMDVAVLTAFGPRAAAGAYAAVNRWGAPFNLYSQSVAQYMLPHYAGADSHQAASRLLRRTNILLAPATVVLVLVSFVSPVAVDFLLGPRYHSAAMALSVLCYGYIAAMYASSYYVFVQARHLDKFAVKVYAIATVVQFLALYPAVRMFGATGASVAFLIGQVILMVGCRRLVQQHTQSATTADDSVAPSGSAEEAHS